MQRADKRKYHYIYKITRFDGYFYIGLHSTDNLDDGYFGSGTRITNSIRYHGKEKHTKRILEFLPSRKAVKEREKQLITEDVRNDPLCMNIAPGGGGGFHNEEHHRKASSNGGKISGKINIRKARVSALSENSVKKAQETRESRGTCVSMRNKKHSPNTLAKMSKSHSGEANSQYGKVWITKDSISKSIPKQQLSKFEELGWVRGRQLPRWRNW